MDLSIIILCVFIFFAGFVDSIAGGGGLISLPAYFFIGMPTLNALATNKFSAACGTTFATIKFYKSKALHWQVATISAIASFIFSYLGSLIAMKINEELLRLIIILVLPLVAIFLLFKKDFGITKQSIDKKLTAKQYGLAFFIGAIIGFYDGLLGPGTGTFAILAYSGLMHYDLLTSSGNAKLLNLASNYASMIAFLINGKILFDIAIPAAIAGIAGNYLGSSIAIKKGNSFVKIIILIVIALLFSKMIWDFASSFKL